MTIDRVLVRDETSNNLLLELGNKESGARELSIIGLRALLAALNSEGSKEKDWSWTLRMTGFHVCLARPAMAAAIEGAVLNVLDEIFAQPRQRREAVKVVEKHIQSEQSTLENLCSVFCEKILSMQKSVVKILTLSNSSTISACLVSLLLENPTIKLRLDILESRPGYEGVTLAKTLLSKVPKEQIDITIASDASVAYFAMEKGTILLLGADRISEIGEVCNKIGSLPAAVLAKQAGNKVLVVAQTSKIDSRDGEEVHVEDNDVQEVIRAWGTEYRMRGVTVVNKYFEWVNGDLVDGYITEEGVLDKVEVRQQWQRRNELREKFFGDL